MKYSILAAAVTTALLASPTVMAQGKDRTLEQELKSNASRFARVDTNSDGKLDAAERLAEATALAKRDGKPVPSGKNGTFGTSNDADGDGMLTLAEVETFIRARFAAQDANGDGVLNPAEKASKPKM